MSRHLWVIELWQYDEWWACTDTHLTRQQARAERNDRRVFYGKSRVRKYTPSDDQVEAQLRAEIRGLRENRDYWYSEARR